MQVVAEERSLGSYLELYTRCLEAENTTLMRNPTPNRFRYSAHIPLFRSHSAIQLTFRYSAHIPLFSSHSTIQLTFRYSAHIPLFSSHSAIQLTFRYFQLTFSHSAAKEMFFYIIFGGQCHSFQPSNGEICMDKITLYFQITQPGSSTVTPLYQ